jgi:radical SAM protein with 4Fe4S-binding SPASM domain
MPADDVQERRDVGTREPVVAEVPFADLQRRLGLRERRLPLQGTLETTFRCNLNCAHCYVNEPAGSAEERARELPLSRLEALIDEIVDEGCLELLLTGGEVLVRPDFPKLYLHAIRRGLVVTVFTNGTLVTEAIADLFDRHRPHAIEISLYGMTRETYERVTRVPGSYRKCLDGIERLVARGLRLTLKTMALTWNQHEVAAMDAYARSLGLPFKFDSLLNPRVDCGANRNGELQLPAEQALALDLMDPERMRDLRDFCERFVRREGEPVQQEYVYNCGAGHMSFTVDPYGHLQMCQLSRGNAFDLRADGFARGWNEHFPKLRERKWQSHSICRTCNLVSLCGSCAGAAEMETGDIEGLVPQFCEIAHMKAWAAMGESCGHRRDATCCLGRDPSTSPLPSVAAGGCGSCGPGAGERPALIQIQRRT